MVHSCRDLGHKHRWMGRSAFCPVLFPQTLNLVHLKKRHCGVLDLDQKLWHRSPKRMLTGFYRTLPLWWQLFLLRGQVSPPPVLVGLH